VEDELPGEAPVPGSQIVITETQKHMPPHTAKASRCRGNGDPSDMCTYTEWLPAASAHMRPGAHAGRATADKQHSEVSETSPTQLQGRAARHVRPPLRDGVHFVLLDERQWCATIATTPAPAVSLGHSHSRGRHRQKGENGRDRGEPVTTLPCAMATW
jgi:hypothetical protein